MEPFRVSNAGAIEVNGTYAFAKKTQGIPEYWFVKEIQIKKKTIEHIFKIRGNVNLSQIGSEFEHCWTVQRADNDNIPIQYYAAPMKSLNEQEPPKHGWIAIGGLDPAPTISVPIEEKEMESIKMRYQSTKSKIDELKSGIGKLKDSLKNQGKESKDIAGSSELKSLVNELKNFQSINEELLYDISCKEIVSRKVNEELRDRLESSAKENFIFTISAEIHGGCAGLYDYGPTGAAMKSNIIQEWRNHFIIEDDMLEVESTMLTPYPVLKASGHVDKFSDYLVRDSKTNDSYRADKIIEAFIDDLLSNKESVANMSENEKIALMQMRSEADGCSSERLDEIINKLGIKAPKTGNDLTNAEEFKLMFDTMIGPTGKTPGFLRPETAQGIFVNFHKLLQFNNQKMPFAAAQIGHSFRNEIAPRGGLLRVREFQMAEIEHFCSFEENYIHPKFKDISNVSISFLDRQIQKSGSENVLTMTMGDAYKKGLICNTTLGYYMARTQLFLLKIGIDFEKIRFRQHKEDEMAHYAGDCWDAEILTSYGWIECVGHADRACFDLTKHMESTNVKLQAEHIYDQPKIVQKLFKTIDKKKIGKKYGRDSKPLLNYLNDLNDNDSNKLLNELNSNGCTKICLNDESGNSKEYELAKGMFLGEFKEERQHGEHYTPKVVEPSFGIGRILYALLENVCWQRAEDENRIVLSLRPRIAPIKVGVVPLSSNNDLLNVAKQIHKSMKKYHIASKIDDSSAAIGRKYARFDEIGIPFGITVDFQTLKDQTVTIRERDTTLPQIRVKVDQVPLLVRDLSREERLWKDVVNQYPHHSEQKV